jgi:hypothetical protein
MFGKVKIFNLILMVLLCSCRQNELSKEDNTLPVDIDQIDKVSISELFERIELIPLETNETSLINIITKAVFTDNMYYIFDPVQDALLCFDENGGFIRQISQKGSGPEEYTEMSDFNVNEDAIKILQPFGIMYVFDKDGHFRETYHLKGEAKNYQYFIAVDDDQTLFWSIAPNKKEYQLFLHSKSQDKFIKSYYRDDRALDVIAHYVFHFFEDKVFFHKPFNNEIFSIENNELKVAYRWDFGKQTMDIRKHHMPINGNEMVSLEKLRNSQIPYHYNVHAQTDLYYYTQLIVRFEKVLHVFYNKRTKRSMVFDTFVEGLGFLPVYWCNDYVIGTQNSVLSINQLINEDLLNDAGKQRLREIKEDDNPCLIKYYFKK